MSIYRRLCRRLPVWPRYNKFNPDSLLKIIRRLDSHQRQWANRGADRPPPLGGYFEFGVWNGASVVDVWRGLKRFYGPNVPKHWQFHLFDSFEGLPASSDPRDDHPFAGKGAYTSNGINYVAGLLKKAGLSMDRLHFVEGFYENSLTEELRNQYMDNGVIASFVTLDCDLYSSTKISLDWIEPLLRDGSIIYFDDIYFFNGSKNKGQVKAIIDFNEERSTSGLHPALHLDDTARTYLYWRDSESNGEKLSF